MKITIEYTESLEKKVATVSTNSDDLDTFELLELITDAVKAFGYSEESIKKAILEFDNWRGNIMEYKDKKIPKAIKNGVRKYLCIQLAGNGKCKDIVCSECILNDRVKFKQWVIEEGNEFDTTWIIM